MRIQALLNDQPVCTAGLDTTGFLSAHLKTEVRSSEPDAQNVLRLVGIETHKTESVYIDWPVVNVKEGDVVTLKLLPDGQSTAPVQTKRSSEAPSNLLTNTELANRILAVCSAFETQLEELLAESASLEPSNEVAKIHRAYAEVAVSLGEHLLYPIYRSHSSLIPVELRGEVL